MASVRRIEGAFITNPARDDPRDFYFKPGASQVLSFKKTQAAADAVLFGIVLKSTLIEGRTYTGANGQDRRLKELEVHPDTQEGERFLAFLSMVSGRKVVTIQTSPDEACLTYSTKHTAVDGSGEEIKSTIILNIITLTLGSLSLQGSLVQESSLVHGSKASPNEPPRQAPVCMQIFKGKHCQEQTLVSYSFALQCTPPYQAS